MSYDIAIITPPIADSDAAAWEVLDQLIDDKEEPPEIFRAFYETLVQRYPCLSTLSGEDSESSVWSSGPIWSGFGSHAAVLSIQFPHADEVVPFVVDAARPLGLSVFDWQTKLVHRPDGLADLELTSEDVAPHKRPTLQQIVNSAHGLTPDGGPGFLILERAGRSYLQVAGGNGVFTCEWRQYDGTEFKHKVAGNKDQAADPDIQIPTNGFHITVKSNERLGIIDVKTLLATFANSGGPPADYAWRDITGRFK